MSGTALTRIQKGRLVTIARRIWKSLSREEQERYYNDTGTIGFIEDVAQLLGLHLCTLTLGEFEQIHTKIFREVQHNG